ncbi:MAG: hypothetical protein WAU32_07205 [Thermoanaerobaculia bacterium]
MSIRSSSAPPAAGLWATVRRRIRDRIAPQFRPRAVKRWLATHLLPEELLYPLWRRRTARTPRSALPTASDLHIIEIQADVRLEIYWASRQLGPGPGACLFVLGDEILRLDCFGTAGLGGHYHINPRQIELASAKTARIFFPPGSHEEHIERAAFELERNLPAALAMNREARIRRFEVDGARLAQASREMRQVMRAMLAGHRDELAP